MIEVDNMVETNTSLTGQIGVIIPVYNCEKYLCESIDSVLTQPYEYIHIVLVDDGSTDSSPAICDRYAMQYDRVHVIHQKNAGVSAARNAGIEYTLSQYPDAAYIAFLDADDKGEAGFFDEDTCHLLLQGYTLVGF